MFFPQLSFFVWSISITYKLFYLHSMKNMIFDHLPPHVRPLATLSYPITSLDRSACFHLSISPVPSQLVHLTHLISCPTPLTLPQAHLLPKLPHTWQFLPFTLNPPLPPLRPPPNSPSYLWQFHSFSLPPPVFIVLSVLCPRWPSLSNPFLCCLFLLEKIRPHFRLSKPS